MFAALAPGGTLAVQVPDRDWEPVLPGSATTWREQVRQGYGPGDLAAALAASASSRVETKADLSQPRRRGPGDPRPDQGRALPIRLLAFPFLAAAVRLERLGLTWGRSNAIFAAGRRRRLNRRTAAAPRPMRLAESSAATTPSRVRSEVALNRVA